LQLIRALAANQCSASHFGLTHFRLIIPPHCHTREFLLGLGFKAVRETDDALLPSCDQAALHTSESSKAPSAADGATGAPAVEEVVALAEETEYLVMVQPSSVSHLERACSVLEKAASKCRGDCAVPSAPTAAASVAAQATSGQPSKEVVAAATKFHFARMVKAGQAPNAAAPAAFQHVQSQIKAGKDPMHVD
jgi:hypothetical protein